MSQKKLARTVYLLNLLDLFCTIAALRMGAKELNPLFTCMPVMVVHKVIIIGILLWWLSRRPEKIARTGIRLCAAVYAALAVYHVAGLILIGGIHYGI